MSFPAFGNEFSNWEQPVTFNVITKTIVDHETVETSTSISGSGVVYTSNAQEIALKPEGQRTWKFYHLITAVTELQLDDIIQCNDNKRYRIMGKEDWSQAGFYDYDMTEAYNA